MERYSRQEEIGRGAWGVVYKAIDHLTDDVVAIKQLIKRNGFPRHEVALARQVTHKNVVRIYDYFEERYGEAAEMP